MSRSPPAFGLAPTAGDPRAPRSALHRPAHQCRGARARRSRGGGGRERAAQGAHTAWWREPETILAVDTLVALGERIYGKPASASAARETIAALVGQTHTVLSGVALLREDREHVALARTEVAFRECDEQLVDWYVDSGEWREKSGGYAIQGLGSVLVREIRGNYENVVGLPLATLLDLCPELLSQGADRRFGPGNFAPAPGDSHKPSERRQQPVLPANTLSSLRRNLRGPLDSPPGTPRLPAGCNVAGEATSSPCVLPLSR